MSVWKPLAAASTACPIRTAGRAIPAVNGPVYAPQTFWRDAMADFFLP